MQTIRLDMQHDVSRWAGELPQDNWYDRVIEGDATVYKPDGTLLMVVLRGALQGFVYQSAYAALAPLARSSPRHNRGIAAGKIQAIEDPELLKGGVAKGSHIGKKSATRYQPVKLDGTLSHTVYAKDTPSFVAGYSERSARFPYCRQTAYTNKYPERLVQLLPCLRLLSEILRSYAPDRHAAQETQAARTSRDFLIPGTVFSTLTINKSWQTALHKDAGDLAAGFGVMACWRAGSYEGGLYVMPAFGVAVDLQAGDVLLSDVHEYHGNTALIGDAKRYERITLVCYFRERMVHCGTAEDELARVKRFGRRGMRSSRGAV